MPRTQAFHKIANNRMRLGLADLVHRIGDSQSELDALRNAGYPKEVLQARRGELLADIRKSVQKRYVGEMNAAADTINAVMKRHTERQPVKDAAAQAAELSLFRDKLGALPDHELKRMSSKLLSGTYELTGDEVNALGSTMRSRGLTNDADSLALHNPLDYEPWTSDPEYIAAETRFQEAQSLVNADYLPIPGLPGADGRVTTGEVVRYDDLIE